MTAPLRPHYTGIEDHDYCAEAARHLLLERERRYPAAIEAGKITPEVAAYSIGLARCVDREWQWVIDPTAPPAPAFDHHRGEFGAHNHLLAAELRASAERARALADRAPDDARAAVIAALYAALSWYQQPAYPGGCARIVADIACRRRMRQQTDRSAPIEPGRAAA